VKEQDKSVRIEQTHVVQDLRPGGIESLALALTSRARGNCQLVSLNGTVPQLVAGWDALKPVADLMQAFNKAPGLKPALVFALARHFRQTNTQSVITHHIGPLLYAGVAARLAGVPVVAHVEHDAWHYQDARRRRLGRSLIRLVRPRLAAVSQTVADGVLAGIGREARIIPNGADLARFTPRSRDQARRELGLPVGQKLIGCAGRLEEVKGFDLLIDAMVKMACDVTAIIFGIGTQERALRQKAERLGLAQRIIFAGLSSDMPSVYPAFDVFCLPSRFEGLPLAALEAQACGIPVAGFDVGGVREALCPKTSRLAPAGDVDALASALAEALHSPSRQSPRDFVSANFSFEQTLRAYADLRKI
jgi:glycosyltransferase involved in cell wall biosynthesis